MLRRLLFFFALFVVLSTVYFFLVMMEYVYSSLMQAGRVVDALPGGNGSVNSTVLVSSIQPYIYLAQLSLIVGTVAALAAGFIYMRRR